MTFHSYDDVKIIFLVNKKHLNVWDKYKELPENEIVNVINRCKASAVIYSTKKKEVIKKIMDSNATKVKYFNGIFSGTAYNSLMFSLFINEYLLILFIILL